MTTDIQKTEKKSARVAFVRQALAEHDGNLALLHAFNEGRVTLKNKGYTQGAAQYRQTRADIARLPPTLANLNAQRALLARELEVLLGYGI